MKKNQNEIYLKEKELKKIRLGDAEAVYLTTLVRWKYEAEEQTKLYLTSAPEQYQDLAEILTTFSVTLPEKYRAEDQTDENLPSDLIIKADQVRRFFLYEKGQFPRKYLADACYLYLFDEIRSRFWKNGEKDDPDARTLYNIVKVETALKRVKALEEENRELANCKEQLENVEEELNRTTFALKESQATAKDAKEQNKKFYETVTSLTQQNEELARENEDRRKERKRMVGSLKMVLGSLSVVLLLLLGNRYYLFTLEKDYHIQPYAPTDAQKNLLIGVWEVYSPSPQARPSQPTEQTYHKVVLNVMRVMKKPGFDYLVFDRHGPGFDQKGRIEFKSPNVVDIYAETVNESGVVISPKHTTLLLEKNQPFLTALSLTWNFDKQNKPIASREVYIKRGDEGTLQVTKNPVADFMARERDAFWEHGNRVDTFRLRNVFLDSLPVRLQELLDENSILLRVPGEIKIISRNDSVGRVLSETFQKQQGKQR